jgi:hypothetical protein
MSRQPTTIDAAASRPLTTATEELQRANQPLPTPPIPAHERVAEVPRDQNLLRARLADDNRPRDGQRLDPVLDRLGLVRTKDGGLRFHDRFSIKELAGLRAQAAATGLEHARASLPAMGPLPITQTPIDALALESFASALGRSFDDILQPAPGESPVSGNRVDGGGFIDKVSKDSLANSLAKIHEGGPIDFNKLSADSLTAVFLRLNIDNPLDAVQMQNQLDEALSKMRQLAITEARAKIEEMARKMRELAAAVCSAIFMVAIIIAILIAIIIALLLSIIVAIIVALVLIIAAAVVKQMLMSKAEKAIEEGCRKAMAMAMQEIDKRIEEERKKALQQMAEASLVGPDGKPIRSPTIRAAVQDDLAVALGKVLDIAKNQGMDAAKAQGPQLIHDSIYPDLLEIGIPPEKADLLAWAITEESMKNLANAVQPPGSVPVGADGKALTDAEIKARLEPKLTAAMAQVTQIADSQGSAAAAAQGPQLIHDALLDELKAMGLSDEYADKYAWAISQEAMTLLGIRVATPGQAPSPGTSTPADPDPAIPPASAPGGRRPGEILEGSGSFTALLGSTLVDDLTPVLLGLVPEARTADLVTAVSTQGPEAALCAALTSDDSMAPVTMLGMTAFVSGAFGDDEMQRILAGELDAQSLATALASAKDRALEALLRVGGHSQEAEARLQRPSNV